MNRPVVGYAPGAYDMFHVGHLRVLERARSECDLLVAGVATDDVVSSAKERPPVIPFEERLEIVSSIRYVDQAVPDPHVDKYLTWQRIGFHVLFKGDDWRGTTRGRELEAKLARVGVRVVYFPYTDSVSSTLLRRRLSVTE
ncbi:adenylyltransferase/cytidyltransferase family protein [Actinopolyspora mortivallis]|uniref:adenylyltransferase/cytidyltransferase family protein n=1 Tax=Actinopolyspora mortivallis TaxID=33906 RepID=UPI0015E5A6C0|nr:adenylyltransferase/cytidyltransferase family protein [Actinopolyspora mortivallis]